MENQPKISTVEAFILVVVAVIADILSVIPILNWIAWLGMGAVMLYLKFGKGILPMGNLIAFVAEFIPFVSVLPLYTAGIALTIWVDWRPESAVAQATQKATDTVGIKRGVKNAHLKNLLIFTVLMAGGYTLVASGQSAPELMVTWKAATYVPANYPGKTLPGDGSFIEVALEVIDGGKIADLSQTEVQWLANRDTNASGRGLKYFSFNANAFHGNQVVDITLPSYKGARLTEKVVIPIARPEVVISGGPDIFRGLLYFFNLTDLVQTKFTWSADGEAVEGIAENPGFLELDTTGLSSGSVINLEVDVQNLLKPLEIASHSIQFVK